MAADGDTLTTLASAAISSSLAAADADLANDIKQEPVVRTGCSAPFDGLSASNDYISFVL